MQRSVTWAGLGVNRAERDLLRRAGFVPSELAHREPLDLVAATDEAITRRRARELTDRASLLQAMTPAKADMIYRLGVTNRADLAARTVDELFAEWQNVLPYTHPAVYDRLASLIETARGTTSERMSVEWWQGHRAREGIDPVLMAWEQRFGPAADDRPSSWRLRLPQLGLQSQIVIGSIDHVGLPRPPRQPKVVAVDDAEDPRVLMGHWQWAGRHGAFLRLENASAGDAVQLRSDSCSRDYVVENVTRGLAPLSIKAEPARLVLMTPPHLRWPELIEHWNLPADCDLERAWIQISVTADCVD